MKRWKELEHDQKKATPLARISVCTSCTYYVLCVCARVVCMCVCMCLCSRVCLCGVYVCVCMCYVCLHACASVYGQICTIYSHTGPELVEEYLCRRWQMKSAEATEMEKYTHR